MKFETGVKYKVVNKASDLSYVGVLSNDGKAIIGRDGCGRSYRASISMMEKGKSFWHQVTKNEI